MGLKLDRIRKNPAQFLSLTGFTAEEFDELALEFRIEWEQHSSHFTLEGKQRQRMALPRKKTMFYLDLDFRINYCSFWYI